jgi:predicted type IV restriction endonuclease
MEDTTTTAPAPAPAQDDAPAAKRTPKAPSVPKWESETRERAKTAVKRFQKPLADLVTRDANEGDTRLLVTDLLCEGLGYDKYEDLTTEYQVKVDFADYGVRVDKQLVAFIEVKRCTQALNEKHLRQVQSYAVNEGVEWMMLTNGREWQLWHMSAGLPVQMDLVLSVDLLSDEPLAKKADAMFHLSREAFKRHAVDELWKTRAATSAKSVAKALVSEKVVEELRKELRRQTGHMADRDRVAQVLRDEVMRPDVL